MQVGTTGVLNKVNEMFGCSSKQKTVSIIKLINHHKPKQAAELAALIDRHQNGNCKCGCKSNGNIQRFSEYLWECYLKYLKMFNLSLDKTFDDCVTFMYNLFISNSLKGSTMEYKVLKTLNSIQNGFEKASELHDFKYAVDLVYKVDGEELFGVQVKPISYKNFSNTNSIVATNLRKNKIYDKTVIYVFYDKEGNILDVENISKDIQSNIKGKN